jgi:hypothetical protein
VADVSEFARAFNVTFPDGIPEDQVLHGVQFPDGRCVLDDKLSVGFFVTVSFQDLELRDGAKVEWQDGGQP